MRINHDHDNLSVEGYDCVLTFNQLGAGMEIFRLPKFLDSGLGCEDGVANTINMRRQLPMLDIFART